MKTANNKVAILFCCCLIIAGHNLFRVVAAFYLFALTVNQDSPDFKDKKAKFMAILHGKNCPDMVKKQGNPVGVEK